MATLSRPDDVEPPQSLTKVLEQSEQAEDLVKESADELAKVNAVLKKEIAAAGVVPGGLILKATTVPQQRRRSGSAGARAKRSN